MLRSDPRFPVHEDSQATNKHVAVLRWGCGRAVFTGDHVSGWANADSVLKLSLPGAGTQPQGKLSVGSTKSDVAAIQGVPTGYYPTYWRYGLATVDFDGERVKGWSNAGITLKVR